MSEKADTQFSEPRVRCLEERSKAREVGNYLNTSTPMEIRLKLLFAQSFLSISSVSTEQSQTCVKSTVAVEQEHQTCCGRAIWSTLRASRFIGNDTYTFNWNSSTRKSFAEAQRTSEEASTTRSIDKETYWCRIPETVEVGQYFMTKHTDEFLQFAEPVTCREYTLPRDEKSTDPKGWIEGNTKIGPVLEVTTSNLQGKHGVKLRIESLIKDNSHSWVRISHGLNKLVTDLIDKKYDDNEQETSTT